MTTVKDLLIEANRRGLRLEPYGATQLAVYYPDPNETQPDFEKKLRRHKPALLKLLRQKLHLAKQVLSEEFNECSEQTFHVVLESLCENYPDPLCSLALEHLKKNHPHYA